MNIGYIKQVEKTLKIRDKIKQFFCMVFTSKFEMGYVFKLVIHKKEKKIDKIVKKLLKQINKVKVDVIVISDKIKNENQIIYETLQEKLYEKDLEILNGRKLMSYMDLDIFNYILNLQKKDIKQEEVYFLIKKENNLDLQFLLKFIEKCKMVNIITNDVENFKKLQENIYQKENILIGVSNNKNKSLRRAKYIFNINMDKKDIEKFKINRNAIIINFRSSIKYNYNTFDGINVNYFSINMPDEFIEQFESINETEEFDYTKLYESILIQKIENERKKSTILSKNDLARRKNIANEIIKQDGIKIISLIGNNGKISETEIMQKNLDKNANIV